MYKKSYLVESSWLSGRTRIRGPWVATAITVASSTAVEVTGLGGLRSLRWSDPSGVCSPLWSTWLRRTYVQTEHECKLSDDYNLFYKQLFPKLGTYISSVYTYIILEKTTYNVIVLYYVSINMTYTKLQADSTNAAFNNSNSKKITTIIL